MKPAGQARVDPWPLPLVASGGSAATGAETRLVHDDASVQIVAWACRCDCAEIRAERTHSHHVMSVLRRGACTIQQRGQDVTVDTGTIVVHRPGSTYHTGHPYGYIDAGWSLAFDHAVAEEILEQCGAARSDAPTRMVSIRRQREWATSLTTLLRLDQPGAVDPLTAQETGLDLLARTHDPDVFSWTPSDPARRAERALVERACESLRARMDHPVRLADVARDAGCSEFRLYRAFRKQRGTSPGEYLRGLRLAAVLDALAAGAPSLTQVAVGAGFAHHSHMTSTFRRYVGRTPTCVRQELATRRRVL